MMERSVGSVVTGPIVLYTVLEKNKPLFDTVHWFTPSQSPLPIDRNDGKMVSFLTRKRRNEEKEWICWNCTQLIDCEWDDGGSTQAFTLYNLPGQSSDIAIHRNNSENRVFDVFHRPKRP